MQTYHRPENTKELAIHLNDLYDAETEAIMAVERARVAQEIAEFDADLADTKVVIRVQQPSGWVYTFQRLVAGGDFVSLALLPI